MKIIQGRGKNRKVLIEMPHPSVVRKAKLTEQRKASLLFCDLLGVRRASEIGVSK